MGTAFFFLSGVLALAYGAAASKEDDEDGAGMADANVAEKGDDEETS